MTGAIAGWHGYFGTIRLVFPGMLGGVLETEKCPSGQVRTASGLLSAVCKVAVCPYGHFTEKRGREKVRLQTAAGHRTPASQGCFLVPDIGVKISPTAGSGTSAVWVLRGRLAGEPVSDKPTYPANLCPLFRCAEVACNCEDFGETVGDAVQTAARSAVRQGAPEHLYQVLSGQQGVHDSF
jgi:hypothetical protein